MKYKKLLLDDKVVIKSHKEGTSISQIDINFKNKAYILGLLYADGNMHKNNNVISLELHGRDKEILEKINKELNHNKPLFVHKFVYKHNGKKINKTYYRLDITNYKIYNDLLSFGLIPNKSLIIK